MPAGRETSAGIAAQIGDAAFQAGDQPLEPLVVQDRGVFRAPGRQLADRAVQVDVEDPPAAGTLAQQVVQRHMLAGTGDDPAADDGRSARGLFFGSDLKLLAVEPVEPVGIGGDAESGEASARRCRWSSSIPRQWLPAATLAMVGKANTSPSTGSSLWYRPAKPSVSASCITSRSVSFKCWTTSVGPSCADTGVASQRPVSSRHTRAKRCRKG